MGDTTDENRRIGDALRSVFASRAEFATFLQRYWGSTVDQLASNASLPAQYAELLSQLSADGERDRFVWRLYWDKPQLRELVGSLYKPRIPLEVFEELKPFTLDKPIGDELIRRFEAFARGLGWDPHQLNLGPRSTANGGSPLPEQLGYLTTTHTAARPVALIHYLREVESKLPDSIPQADRAALSAWLAKHDPVNDPLQSERPIRLIFTIHVAAQSSYRVAAFWGFDEATLTPIPREVLHPQSVVPAAELPQALQEAVRYVVEKLSSDRVQTLTLEIAVPLEEVDALRVETWAPSTKRPRNRPYAETYRLCLRLVDRMHDSDLRADWLRRWPPKESLTWVSASADEDALDKALRPDSHRIVCVEEAAAAVAPLLDWAQSFGYGAVLFIRGCSDPVSARALLDEVAARQDVLSAVQTRHRERSRSELDTNLVVVWDDPHCRPPALPDRSFDP
ncbi:MAG: hypothetical protein U0271_36085 [Polyangiaceae bacterium]